jgi:hypothetical protein
MRLAYTNIEIYLPEQVGMEKEIIITRWLEPGGGQLLMKQTRLDGDYY